VLNRPLVAHPRGALGVLAADRYDLDAALGQLVEPAVELAQLRLADRTVQAPVEDDHRELVGSAVREVEGAATHERQLEFGSLLARADGVEDVGGHWCPSRA